MTASVNNWAPFHKKVRFDTKFLLFSSKKQTALILNWTLF